MISQWSLKYVTLTGSLILAEIDSGSSSSLYAFHSFPRKGENSTSAHSVGEQIPGAYAAAAACVLSQAARLQCCWRDGGVPSCHRLH